MGWFQKLCRKSGLLLHDVQHAGARRRVTDRRVEEKRVSDKVTVRRTTIEEIEVKPGKDDPRHD